MKSPGGASGARGMAWALVFALVGCLGPLAAQDQPGPVQLKMQQAQVREVPDVRGEPPHVAERMLRARGLVPARRDEEEAPGNRPGTVSRTDPSGGLVRVGSTVAYWVARAPAHEPVPEPVPEPVLVTVPDIAGRAEALARVRIAEAGLVAQRAGLQDGQASRGTVTEPAPPAGSRVARGTTVRYFVASGRDRVPDVRGLSTPEARRQLEGKGFGMATPQPRHDQGEPGRVLEQQPDADSVADLGAAVAVWVSEELRVPDVRGMQQGEAEATLASAGLDAVLAGEVLGPGPRGRVLDTDPFAGTRVLPGQDVRFRMTSGTNIVPSLSGMGLDEAGAALGQAGFVLGSVDSRADPGPQGVVVGQAHEGGASVAPVGLAIDVVLASSLPPPPPPSPPPLPPPPPPPRNWLPVFAGSALVLLLAAGWWTQLRPWPWTWPPAFGARVRLEPDPEGARPPDALLDPDTPGVVIRARLDRGDSSVPDPLPIDRVEVRHE